MVSVGGAPDVGPGAFVLAVSKCYMVADNLVVSGKAVRKELRHSPEYGTVAGLLKLLELMRDAQLLVSIQSDAKKFSEADFTPVQDGVPIASFRGRGGAFAPAVKLVARELIPDESLRAAVDAAIGAAPTQ